MKCPECGDHLRMRGKCSACGWSEKTKPFEAPAPKCMQCQSTNIATTIINKGTGLIKDHLCLDHTHSIDRNWRDNFQYGLMKGMNSIEAMDYARDLDSKRVAQNAKH